MEDYASEVSRRSEDRDRCRTCRTTVKPCLCVNMVEVWRDVWKDEAKAYCRQILRLAKRTGDYSECTGATADAIERVQRVREIENIFASEAEDRNNGRANSRWFVTLNPSQTVDPVELWQKVTGYLSKNDGRGIKAWHAVIEQRSEDGDSPQGWHVHCCVEYNDLIARSIVYQKWKATAAYFWSAEQMRATEYKKHWFTVKPLEEYHRKYVEGEKRDEKMAKVRADKIARQRYGFPEFLSGSEKIFPGDGIVGDAVVSLVQKEGEEDCR